MIARSLIVPLIALSAVPVVAQQAGSAAPDAKPSVEGYLCTFAGKCDGVAAEQVSRDAPRTKGFRLARPLGDSASMDGESSSRAAVRPSVTRKPRSAVAYGAAPRRYVATETAVAPGASTRPRADLMIGFDLNSAQLSAEGVAATQVFARSLLMPELRAKRFLIEGHTDLRGGRSANVALSQARAKSVADYLVVLGVKRDRLQTRGYGPDVPLPGHRATDPTNRRVEAELIS